MPHQSGADHRDVVNFAQHSTYLTTVGAIRIHAFVISNSNMH